jgi:Ser/Thr protein kinase RdoA (MazF antagonist)
VNAKNQKSSFYDLDPENVLQATEAAGFQPTGAFSQLNSYENRVFDLRLEGPPDHVIAKFYRPHRWTQEAILEEHSFLEELASEGIAAPRALQQRGGQTLREHQGLWVAFFEKARGRMSTELLPEDLTRVGRILARLHNVGIRKDFKHRPILADSPLTPWEMLDKLAPKISHEVRARYERALAELLRAAQDQIDPDSFLRIHGDCHRGNLLHNGKVGGDSDFFIVDFDDTMMGPVIQDVWLLFSSSDEDSSYRNEEVQHFLKGYEEFREFPHQQIEWIPILRGLRIFAYAFWISERWTDPSFPRIFPQFGSYNYWAEETEALEKAARSSSGLTGLF